MSGEGKQEKLRLGFLTAVELPEGGYVGGLLVTNHFGRPLEFQCTTPVQPNRTQQILYGPTLVPFILGELIGKTLVEKVGVKPDLILTERDDLLELREHVRVPVACLSGSDDRDQKDYEQAEAARIDVGRQVLRFHPAHGSDREVVEQKARQIPGGADLREPFERVREALKETAGAAR